MPEVAALSPVIDNSNLEAEDASIQLESPAGSNIPVETPQPQQPDTQEARVEKTTEPVTDVTKIPSFADFKSRGEKPLEVPAIKEKKTEVPVEDLTKEEAQQVPVQQQKPAPQVNGRDYSGIEVGDVPFFKRMPNEAFARLAPIYKESARLKQENATLKAQKRPDGLPPNYYEHPEAYILTPEFKAQSERATAAQKLEDHWIDQLASVEEGGQWKNVSIDAQGNIQTSAPMDVTPEVRKEIRKALSVTQRQNADEQGKLLALQHTFKSRRDSSVAVIKSFEDKFFPGWDDEKHTTKKLQDEIISQYPEEFRDHPTTRLLAKTGAALAQYQGLYKLAQDRIAVLEGKKKDTTQMQPTNGSMGQGAGGKVPSSIKFSDFKNRE